MATAAGHALKARAHLLAEIRAFFLARNVLEVETPLLSRAAVCDPNLQNLSTQIIDQTYYLQTSPESAMKCLLSLNSGCIFQICKAFRDDQPGQLHNPEFTLLEWYRCGFDYRQLMDEVEQLITMLIGEITISRISYRDIFQQILAVDPFTATIVQLRLIADPVQGQVTRNDLLDLLLSTKILPNLKGAVFIFDYPADQAAMAKIRGDVAERFELIIDGIELANGYSELTNSAEQKQRFQQENKLRLEADLKAMPIDQKLLDALDRGIPECAGVAIGLDRLLMLILNKKLLAEVLLFPIETA